MRRGIQWPQRTLCVLLVFLAVALDARSATYPLGLELEPNDTPAEATPLLFDDVKITGHIFPSGDVDWFSFPARAGDRLFAATMTAHSASGNLDSDLRIYHTNGLDVLERDADDGTLGAMSSSIAGCDLPSDGTYFVQVRHATTNSQIRPYDLWLRLRRGPAAAENEPNDVPPGQALSSTGWVNGIAASTGDVDVYAVSLNAGDTVFLSLDLNPGRGSNTWNGSLGFGTFGITTLSANDANAGGSNSEAFFMTVRDAGVYSAVVNTSGDLTNPQPYTLSFSVLPAPPGPFAVYASTNAPMSILDLSAIQSTLTIPDDKRVGRLRVSLHLAHENPSDLDISLTAPDGNVVGLVSDVGSASFTNWSFVLDDEAGAPAGAYTVLNGMVLRTELQSRLGWFSGQRAQGAWTLTIADDAGGATGTLLGWGLALAEDIAQPAGATTTLFRTDFEANDGGFVHGGTLDEWEWGAPLFAPITNAHSGANGWVTDLDNTYNTNSSQDLFSPEIDLSALPPSVPIFLSWAMKYQLESATFDHAFVEIDEVGGIGASRRVWEWLGATQTHPQGNPLATIPAAAGWGLHRALISDFAGKVIRARFHLDSDFSVQHAGLAIDDVSVTAFPGIFRSGPAVAMNFMGVPARPYRVQHATNLVSGSWGDVVPPVVVAAPETGAFPFTVTNPAAATDHFRLVPVPP